MKVSYLCNGICVNNACVSNTIREKVRWAAALQEEPLVLPHVLHRGSLHRVRLQHVAEQGHLVAHGNDAFLNENGVFSC